MIKIYKIVSIIIIALAACSFAYCETVTMEELVDQYSHATDIQKAELEKHFMGSKIAGSGTVENVGEYDFFDVTNDTGGKYYKVLALQQETLNKVPYQIIFLYKDKDNVKDISRGQKIEKEANIVKILDERLQISVWLYDGELTQKEKNSSNNHQSSLLKKVFRNVAGDIAQVRP